MRPNVSSKRVGGNPHSAARGGFWNVNGGYERFRNRAEWEQRRYGSSKPRHRFCGYRLAKDRGLIPEYVEGRRYSKQQLEWMADQMIFEDPDWNPDGSILNPDMYKRRIKHEIFVGLGTPDPAIVSGLYWRTHPQGLSWNPPEKAKRDGFYRD